MGVAGTFAGLPEGATLSLAVAGMLKISYVGGDGNDVTLEVPLVDAGAEAGPPMDAAVDGTASNAGPDATVPADAGADGNGQSAPDANVPDATLVADAAAPDASAVDSSAGEDGGASAPSSASGCGCDLVRRDTSGPGAFLTAGLALLALHRRRRAASAPR